MNKAEIASYLVSLHTLMDAQSKVGYSIPSNVLAEEYTKHWKLLKDAIAKDNQHETRNGKDNNLGNQTRTDLPRSQPSVRLADRRPDDESPPDPNVHGPRY